MKVKPCPVCGHRRTYLLRAIDSKKPLRVECCCCLFTAGNARTAWGAVRLWNKAGKKQKKKD